MYKRLKRIKSIIKRKPNHPKIKKLKKLARKLFKKVLKKSLDKLTAFRPSKRVEKRRKYLKDMLNKLIA
jgi:glutamyl-tRNA reductase